MGRVIAYSTGHVSAEIVCRAFAAGAKCAVEPIEAGLQPGAAAFLYGKLRGGLALIERCQWNGVDFFYADNGYIKPGHFEGFFKVTRDAFQCDGTGVGDLGRLRALGISVRPWRRGPRVLICPPIAEYCRVHGFDGAAWERAVIETLAAATDRPLQMRYRPGDPRAGRDQKPLAEDLGQAWALVTHDSNVVVEALIAGVPVFVTGDSPARAVGKTDVAEIETPAFPDNREDWLAVLAANQWTVDEMRSGRCWADLKERNRT